MKDEPERKEEGEVRAESDPLLVIEGKGRVPGPGADEGEITAESEPMASNERQKRS